MIKSMDNLRTTLAATAWFSQLGSVGHEPDVVYVRNFNWRLQEEPLAGEDSALTEILDTLQWLPTSRTQPDPICGEALDQLARESGLDERCMTESLRMYKLVLEGLRSFDSHPALHFGPHNSANAARNAALYAARRATYEIILNTGNFWCRAIEIYHQGHWPFAVAHDQRFVAL